MSSHEGGRCWPISQVRNPRLKREWLSGTLARLYWVPFSALMCPHHSGAPHVSSPQDPGPPRAALGCSQTMLLGAERGVRIACPWMCILK